MNWLLRGLSASDRLTGTRTQQALCLTFRAGENSLRAWLSQVGTEPLQRSYETALSHFPTGNRSASASPLCELPRESIKARARGQMSRVVAVAAGYEFLELGAIGRRLVNEFQRQHPHLCHPSDDPSYRYIRRGLPKENLRLQKLVDEVRARDQEPTSKILPFPGRRVDP